MMLPRGQPPVFCTSAEHPLFSQLVGHLELGSKLDPLGPGRFRNLEPRRPSSRNGCGWTKYDLYGQIHSLLHPHQLLPTRTGENNASSSQSNWRIGLPSAISRQLPRCPLWTSWERASSSFQISSPHEGIPSPILRTLWSIPGIPDKAAVNGPTTRGAVGGLTQVCSFSVICSNHKRS
ncbi:hypothetical protein VTK26DRAFT_6940 [Humicola hyalothermophila]